MKGEWGEVKGWRKEGMRYIPGGVGVMTERNKRKRNKVGGKEDKRREENGIEKTGYASEGTGREGRWKVTRRKRGCDREGEEGGEEGDRSKRGRE